MLTAAASRSSTSRRALRVPGERVLRTPPLSAPPPGRSVDEALSHGAVALFVDRVRAQVLRRHHRNASQEAMTLALAAAALVPLGGVVERFLL